MERRFVMHDFGYLRVLLHKSASEWTLVNDGDYWSYIHWWHRKERSSWELRLFWLELRWRVHRGQVIPEG